ncbi:carbonic anhydrase [Lentzea sp. NEAU-D7]|uniref:carbonic anhydrase n=1 Tax=Lentzea sp. NEAU-D7 TaxID=2994667 RepID=UPI00224B146F|nr:carbonic anhydrase [Lentzea sp. NEAU-D7]MCX2951398.1 carbonic anhydrase [Lentzea sp. NEAU-D7]
MAVTARPSTSSEALAALVEGNRRFVADQPAHPNQDAARRRSSAGTGQRPFAVVLGCSDSRVAAEIVFDQGLGDLFVVRTAGHLAGTDVLASVEFGVTVLGAPLVVVLGHDNCGAITAALTAHDTGTLPPGFLRTIVERIGPEVLAAHSAGITDRDAIGQLHVEHTAEMLLQRSALLTDAVTSHHAAIVAMTYQLDNGRVHLVAQHGDALTAALAENTIT